MLQVKGNQIIDAEGKTVRLRGVCVGGWMNMENFINGYPGDEHGLRSALAETLGPAGAEFFFNRWLDHFFTEQDVAYIKSCGATVVRLPFNYRHFEQDAAPFKYLEDGFARLEQAVQWCARHDLYVILDLHAVQGWQSSDWHCDNSSRHAHFWQHPHFQDRFVALWEEFARRYKGNATIAGYNVMNEPVTNAPAGRFYPDSEYKPDWDAMNRVYRRVVQAIRVIDPDHIIFLEGDLFSSRFEQLEAPFADNLVYSSHNYSSTTYDFRQPAIDERQRQENRAHQNELFMSSEGTRFAQKYQVPLWVGEFGANGASGLEDQLDVFEEFGAHWTIWTYKDVGRMGFLTLSPDSEYMQLLAPVLQAKQALGVDEWLAPDLRGAVVTDVVRELARLIEKTIGDPHIDPASNFRYLAQSALAGYTSSLMQPVYARRFHGMREADIDRVLQSFAFENCSPLPEIMAVLKKYWTNPA